MLEIKNLCVSTKKGKMLLNNVSLQLKSNECIGVTGASGSGKTTLIKSILGMYKDNWRIVSGDILLDGISILNKTKKERRELCGITFGFIPQNSMTAFFPNTKLGKQMVDIYIRRLKITKEEAYKLCESSLKSVNLKDALRIMNAFPTQLSGGMLQRIIVAISLGLKPKYILADEPTSALDEENRNMLLKLLKEQRKIGILFVSHDIFALKNICIQTIVIQGGKIIENESTKKIFSHPQAVWTKRFVESTKKSEGGEWEWSAFN